jgi:hypothetical protein
MSLVGGASVTAVRNGAANGGSSGSGGVGLQRGLLSGLGLMPLGSLTVARRGGVACAASLASVDDAAGIVAGSARALSASRKRGTAGRRALPLT